MRCRGLTKSYGSGDGMVAGGQYGEHVQNWQKHSGQAHQITAPVRAAICCGGEDVICGCFHGPQDMAAGSRSSVRGRTLYGGVPRRGDCESRIASIQLSSTSERFPNEQHHLYRRPRRRHPVYRGVLGPALGGAGLEGAWKQLAPRTIFQGRWRRRSIFPGSSARVSAIWSSLRYRRCRRHHLRPS